MSIQSLLNTLEQKVQQLTQAYQADSDKKINAKFNRTLFTEDFETAGFYLKEIQQSLTKLCSLPHQNEEQIIFMTLVIYSKRTCDMMVVLVFHLLIVGGCSHLFLPGGESAKSVL